MQRSIVPLQTTRNMILRRCFRSTTTRQFNATATRTRPNTKPSLQDVFPPIQFVPIWETHYPNHGGKLENDALDTATKHVIAMIQRLYRRSYFPIPSFVTREWCHHLLQQLGESSASDRSNFVPWAHMQRAKVLLEAMQLTSELDTRSMPFELPRPNGKTYRLVLEVYARTEPPPTDNNNNLLVAHQARDLVLRMEADYRATADLTLRPTVVEWNRVLETYAQAQHDDRATYAVQVLLEHVMTATDGRSLSFVDTTSLLLAFRACMYRVPSPQAATKGAVAAAKLWERLVDDPSAHHLWLQCKSHVYSHFMQAIRHLPPSDQRERLFAQAMEQARRYGKVNDVIVNEFIVHAKPMSMVQSILGKERLQAVKGLPPQQAAQQLVASLPASWSQHQDSN